MASRQRRLSLCLLCLMGVIIYIQFAGAQFFTKSVKSIPRVGRRSASGPSAASGINVGQYRRSLIDSLVEQYGPDLVEVLEAQAKTSEANKRSSSGEVALRNDQPLDLVRSQAEYGDSPIEIFALDRLAGEMNRDERSVHPPLSASPTSSLLMRNNNQIANQKDSSLALRALNTNRLIQHLASGQPLITSYDMLVYNGQDRNFAPNLRKQQQEPKRDEAIKYSMGDK